MGGDEGEVGDRNNSTAGVALWIAERIKLFEMEGRGVAGDKKGGKEAVGGGVERLVRFDQSTRKCPVAGKAGRPRLSEKGFELVILQTKDDYIGSQNSEVHTLTIGGIL